VGAVFLRPPSCRPCCLAWRFMWRHSARVFSSPALQACLVARAPARSSRRSSRRSMPCVCADAAPTLQTASEHGLPQCGIKPIVSDSRKCRHINTRPLTCWRPHCASIQRGCSSKCYTPGTVDLIPHQRKGSFGAVCAERSRLAWLVRTRGAMCGAQMPTRPLRMAQERRSPSDCVERRGVSAPRSCQLSGVGFG
jgi:hypothetical protein